MTEQEEYPELPPEEQWKIAQHFILQSPPGQVRHVIRDVTNLIPSSVMTDAKLQQVMQTYNAKNHLIIPVEGPSPHKMVVCQDGQIDATHYIDAIGETIVEVDHVEQKLASEATEPVPETPHEATRAALQAAFTQYLEQKYASQAACGVFVKDSNIVAVMNAESVNLRNYWSGRWKSRWELDCSSQQTILKGQITLYIHYFENGNLQLHEMKAVHKELENVSPSALATSVIEAVREAEDAIQYKLEEMYTNMSQETFKEMRRVMPITRTKMDWNVHAHRTARDLRK